MYAFLGGSSLIAVAHGVSLHGLEQQNKRMSLDWMVVMALFNFVGAFTYALRFPERWWPRRFDIIGSSHQVMHVMVIFAGLAHMRGLLRAFDYWHSGELKCE